MRKILFYCVLVSFSISTYGQDWVIDSLMKELSKPGVTDTTEIDLYIALSKQFIPISIDSTEKYSKLGLEKSLNGYKYNIVRAYNNRGNVFDIKSQPDSARYFYDKALKELDKNDNILERSLVYSNYSLSYQNSDRMDLALEYNSKAIDLIEDDDLELCYLYFNQAILYMRSEIPEIGKKYLRLAYESSVRANEIRVEGAALQSLGFRYIEEKKLDSARIYLEKGLSICNRTKSSETCFRVHSALGSLYMEMGKFPKAQQSILEAKRYAVSRNKTDDILLSLIALGELENKRGRYNKSSQYFNQFEYLYATEGRRQPTLELDAYKIWSDTESKKLNHKKSYELLSRHMFLKDSLLKKENKELLTEANAKFETEKKDKEIAEQQLALVDQNLKLEKNSYKTRLMSILIVFLLLASILLWFIFQQRQKRIHQQLIAVQKEQEILTLESLIAGEEKERLRIAKELHDGVNGDLSAIKYKLSSLLKMNNEVINEAVTMIDNSCQQVRAISHNLVPPSLKNFNLIEAVSSYCENMTNTHKQEVSFQHIGENIVVPKKVEVNIFRIIQELVTNAIKHADAQSIDVQISNRNSTLLITVEDNGGGYRFGDIKSEGIGLENVKSRVEYLNARLDVVTNDSGTYNTIEINLKNLDGN